ncbi:MAG: ComF family protein [Bacteroidia bacterium]
MKMNLYQYVQDFLGLFYPNTCLNCECLLYKSEKFICTNCLINLPIIGYFDKDKHPVEHIFHGRIKLFQADAWLYFKKGGISQKLMHELKYNGNYNLGVYLGSKYGQSLKKQECNELPDIVTFVPMHPKKQRVRGYNQSQAIAEGFAKALGVPLHDNLIIKCKNSRTQTRKKKYERWDNSKDSYSLNSNVLDVKMNIGLIDDVVTTGATLEACSTLLKESGFEKTSVFALCLAIN